MTSSSPVVPSVTPSGAANSTVTSTHTPTLLTLPLELHLLIGAHLPFPAYLSLRLTHPYLYHALVAPTQPPSVRELDKCARIAVRTYLAPYLSPTSTTRDSTINLDSSTAGTGTVAPLKYQTSQQQQRCALCGNAYPVHLFKSAASPACSPQDLSPVHTIDGPLNQHRYHFPALSLSQAFMGRAEDEKEAMGTKAGACERPDRTARESTNSKDILAKKRRGEPGWDVIELPQRVCCWHVGRLTRMVKVEQQDAEMKDVANDNGTENGMNSSSCRAMSQSHRAASGRSNKSPPLRAWVSRVEQMCTHCGAIQAWRPCRCRCQGCGLRAARTYTRYEEPGWSCAGFVFWRDDRGTLWVRETVAGVGLDGIIPTPTISLHFFKCLYEDNKLTNQSQMAIARPLR